MSAPEDLSLMNLPHTLLFWQFFILPGSTKNVAYIMVYAPTNTVYSDIDCKLTVSNLGEPSLACYGLSDRVDRSTFHKDFIQIFGGLMFEIPVKLSVLRHPSLKVNDAVAILLLASRNTKSQIETTGTYSELLWGL